MPSPASDYVTLAEVLQLTRPFAEFEAAARALAQRLEVEGVRGLKLLQLSANPGSTEVGVVLCFSNGGELLQHVEMLKSWDEFKQFAGTVKLETMRVYGKLPPAVQDWMRQFQGDIKRFETSVAGFVR
jgi:hypothetical protein